MKRAPLVLALLSLACCDPTIEGSVCGFGDSLLVQAGEELQVALGEGRFLPDGTFLTRDRSDTYTAIAAMLGARLDASILTNWHAGRLETSGVPCGQVFVSFGTNDAGGPVPGFEGVETLLPVPARIERFMGDMAGRPVLWLVPHARDRRESNIAEWQAALASAATRWPNLILLWGDPGWIGPDGLHYTPEGQSALANAVADHLEEMLP